MFLVQAATTGWALQAMGRLNMLAMLCRYLVHCRSIWPATSLSGLTRLHLARCGPSSSCVQVVLPREGVAGTGGLADPGAPTGAAYGDAELLNLL